MRYLASLAVLAALVACSSEPADSSKLTLKNMAWDHVHVQIVITKGSDCDARGPDFVGEQNLVLLKDQTKTVVAPNGTTVCWRRDRYPNKPVPGEWSGWSRAILFPDQDTTTDL